MKIIMKKYVTGIILLLFACVSIAMEKKEDDKKRVDILPYDISEDCLFKICNYLCGDFINGLLSSLPGVVTILSVPQMIYPNTPFDGIFFDNLCNQNYFFLKARDLMIAENQAYIKNNIKGSTIDNYKTFFLPAMQHLIVFLRKYLHKKTMQQCKADRWILLPAHSDHITGISMNAKKIVSGSKDKMVHVFDARTGNLLGSLQYNQPVSCVSLHPIKPIVAIVTQDALDLCDTENGDCLSRFNYSTYTFDRAYFDMTGRYITAYSAQENKQRVMEINHNNKLIEHCITGMPVLKNGCIKRCSFRAREVAVQDDISLLLKVNTHISTLCENAYHNSKNDVKELNALLSSHVFQDKLLINDKTCLTEFIYSAFLNLQTNS